MGVNILKIIKIPKEIELKVIELIENIFKGPANSAFRVRDNFILKLL